MCNGAPGETRTPNIRNLNPAPLPIGLQAHNGDPGAIRTPDLNIRSVPLYPAELRDQYSI